MNITPDIPQLSVTERIARIRLCMRVEQVTGIATVHKEVFLPLCLESETSDENKLYGIARPVTIAFTLDRQNDENWPDNDWVDWGDS